ncbi:YqgE/AlgH family protein [Alphaproteobacteria bacterium KMM 3653]|uniref:UPF0301 protein IV417_11555 n=1 Tax=Harenicola maris TaxID=2841044 RepID=A0AAP2CUN3_9RHOB|nr:YqgE/AlgH family protein [Harenicola maris]
MDLTGKLLIAMPGMGDPRFERSVIYLCSHSGDGAMGLIVNHPAPGLSLKGLLEQLEIESAKDSGPRPLHYGGPVENGRGFVLHSAEYTANETTMTVDTQFSMSATLDILEDIAAGNGPRRTLLALGYSGWGPMQLENEILSNGWLTTDADPDLVFNVDDTGKWQAALATLGVDPLTLSADAGHA